jgi:hypothetical protein
MAHCFRLLVVRTANAIIGISTTALVAIVLAGNVFVAPTMPGWLQAIVDVDPVSHAVTSLVAVQGLRSYASRTCLRFLTKAAFRLTAIRCIRGFMIRNARSTGMSTRRVNRVLPFAGSNR